MRMIDADKLIMRFMDEELDQVQSKTGEELCQIVESMATVEQTRWIPVSEELPTDHNCYVIVVKEKSTGYQYIPRIAIHNHDNCWSIIDTEDADKDWLDDLECVAWMPLPQPYKGESEVQDADCD